MVLLVGRGVDRLVLVGRSVDLSGDWGHESLCVGVVHTRTPTTTNPPPPLHPVKNQVETAVRLKHLPTGLTVRCQEERSQLANRKKALAYLKEKLLVIQLEQRVAELSQIKGDLVEASWGQQIRNYVFQPYKLVKDTRTGVETADVQAVLDGGEALDAFVNAYLRQAKGSEGGAGRGE